MIKIADMVKRFGLKGSVGALMTLAMIASWGNVYDYLSSGHTNPITTAALATALGVGLVVASHGVMYMEARPTMAYASVCVVTVGIAAVTGMVQSIGYSLHYDGWQPYIMGYGVPFLLEVGLAFFAKAIEKEQRRRVLSDMQEALANGTMSALADAAHSIDPAIIRDTAQRESVKFSRLVMRSTFEDMYAELLRQRNFDRNFEVQELQDPVQITEKAAQNGVLRSNIEEINSKRSRKIEERQTKIVELVNNGVTKLSDIIEAIGVSENTIRKDVEALAVRGLSISNGVLSAVPSGD